MAKTDAEAYVDRIGAEIVAILNRESQKDDFDPVLLMGGQLLALKTLLDTATSLESVPKAFVELKASTDRCLRLIAALLFNNESQLN